MTRAEINHRRNPFEYRPGDQFVVPRSVYSRIYEIIQNSFLDNKQLIFLTGCDNAGKTTLLGNFIRGFDTNIRHVYLHAEDFADWRRRKSDRQKSGSTLDTVKVFILEQSRISRHNILIIDDAHRLEDRVLTSLLSLLKSKSVSQNQICLLLAGDDSIIERVEGFRYFSIDDVSHVECRLDHLTLFDIRLYVRQRLEKVGLDAIADEIFPDEICELILQHTKGNFRHVNELCGRAFAIADEDTTSTITPEHVERALPECDFSQGVTAETSESSGEPGADNDGDAAAPAPHSYSRDSVQVRTEYEPADSGYVARMSERIQSDEIPQKRRAEDNFKLAADTLLHHKDRRNSSNRHGNRPLMFSLFASGTIAGILVIFLVIQILIPVEEVSNITNFGDNPRARQQIVAKDLTRAGQQGAEDVLPARETSQDFAVADLPEADTAILTDAPDLLSARDSLARAERMLDLFDMARIQMNAGKLTEPAGDNAFETYRKILKIEPDNNRAKARILDLKIRYTTLAEIAVEEERFNAAREMYKKALYLDPTDQDIASLIERYELDQGAKVAAVAETESAPEDKALTQDQTSSESDHADRDAPVDTLLVSVNEPDIGISNSYFDTVVALTPEYTKPVITATEVPQTSQVAPAELPPLDSEVIVAQSVTSETLNGSTERADADASASGSGTKVEIADDNSDNKNTDLDDIEQVIATEAVVDEDESELSVTNISENSLSVLLSSIAEEFSNDGSGYVSVLVAMAPSFIRSDGVFGSDQVSSPSEVADSQSEPADSSLDDVALHAKENTTEDIDSLDERLADAPINQIDEIALSEETLDEVALTEEFNESVNTDLLVASTESILPVTTVETEFADNSELPDSEIPEPNVIEVTESEIESLISASDEFDQEVVAEDISGADGRVIPDSVSPVGEFADTDKGSDEILLADNTVDTGNVSVSGPEVDSVDVIGVNQTSETAIVDEPAPATPDSLNIDESLAVNAGDSLNDPEIGLEVVNKQDEPEPSLSVQPDADLNEPVLDAGEELRAIEVGSFNSSGQSAEEVQQNVDSLLSADGDVVDEPAEEPGMVASLWQDVKSIFSGFPGLGSSDDGEQQASEPEIAADSESTPEKRVVEDTREAGPSGEDEDAHRLVTNINNAESVDTYEVADDVELAQPDSGKLAAIGQTQKYIEPEDNQANQAPEQLSEAPQPDIQINSNEPDFEAEVTLTDNTANTSVTDSITTTKNVGAPESVGVLDVIPDAQVLGIEPVVEVAAPDNVVEPILPYYEDYGLDEESAQKPSDDAEKAEGDKPSSQTAAINDSLSSEQSVDPQGQQINKLVEKARSQIRRKRLTTPSSDNAYSTYQTILDIEPDNERALAGIRDIKQIYLSWAKTAEKQGRKSTARGLYEKALSIDPDDAELLDLLDKQAASDTRASETEKKSDKDISAEQKARRVAKLIEEALDHTNDLRYTTPAGNNAFETYQKVLALDPQNTRAKAGLLDLKRRYIDWAKKAARKGNNKKAVSMYERALLIDPADEKIAAAINRVKKTEEASPADKKDENKKSEQNKTDSKEKAERINILIERALSKTSEKKLTTPSGDSAFDIYREVLRIDPNNLSAQSGILDIRDKYIRWAEAALKKDEPEKAVGFYKKALLIDPDDSQLADLVSRLSKDASGTDAENTESEDTENAEESVSTETESIDEDEASKDKELVAATNLLFTLVEEANTDLIQEHIAKHGLSPDVRRGDKQLTPLMTAAVKGVDASVVPLLTSGADIDARDNDGNTALSLAIKYGQPSFARQMVFQGASVNTANKRGETPLHLSARSGNVEVTRLLLKRGAEINSLDKSGNTPLILAAINNHNDCVKTLVKSETQMNIANSKGWTALMYASKNGNLEMVQHIIFNTKVHDNVRNDNVRRSIEVATHSGYGGIASLLQHEMLNFSPP